MSYSYFLFSPSLFTVAVDAINHISGVEAPIGEKGGGFDINPSSTQISLWSSQLVALCHLTFVNN